MVNDAILRFLISACQAFAPSLQMSVTRFAPRGHQVTHAQTLDNALAAALPVFANDQMMVMGCAPRGHQQCLILSRNIG